MSEHRIKLPDGTVWPHPRSEHAFAERQMAVAYCDLLLHPWGTEVSVKKLRMLRRALRRARGGQP